MLKKILKVINGKDYYSLSKDEKRLLRNNEYERVLDSYIVISNTFLIFSLVVLILSIQNVINVPTSDPIFALIVAVAAFLFIVSVMMLMQKNKLAKGAEIKLKIDLFINVIILLFLTIMTLVTLDDGSYLLLYAVGLITFVLLVRVKPNIVLMYFLIVLAIIIGYINITDTELVSSEAFYINITALNIIMFFSARMLFIEHIKRFAQQKMISDQNIELENLATKDFLTNTYNRRGFSDKINNPLKLPAAVCLFDLDGLKLINDAFGHEKGDEAIVLAVNTIRKCFDGAFLARLGGDEFVVIAEQIAESTVEEKIRAFTSSMENASSLEVAISASVGYEMVKNNGDVMDAFKKAENIMYHLKLGARSSRKNRSMEALLAALYDYTGETERHCHSVGHISYKILQKMGYSRKSELESIKIAGQLHDIGKLSIPESVLKKDGELNDEEWTLLKRHSEESYKIACGLIDDKDIVDAILYHHERWDGGGYPYNIEGDNIPLFARIIAVADAYDAMTSERHYTGKRTHEEALEEIKSQKSLQFDPEIVEIFLKLSDDELKF